MAAGDLVVFDEAKATMLTGGWAAADDIRVALITTLPLVGDTTPALADYTECTAGGNYVAVTATTGELLASYTACVVEATGTMTFDDTGATVVWAQGGGLSTTVRWAVVYNQTASVPGVDPCICFVDLGSDRDLTAGSLTITWNAAGLFTII